MRQKWTKLFGFVFVLSMIMFSVNYDDWFPPVNVRWAVGVALLQRQALESNYYLTEPQRAGERTWSYRIRDGWVLGRSAGGAFPNVGAFGEVMPLNAIAMKRCRAKHALCIDLAHELFFHDGDFYDYVHNTPTGARRIADYLHRKLRDRI